MMDGLDFGGLAEQLQELGDTGGSLGGGAWQPGITTEATAGVPADIKALLDAAGRGRDGGGGSFGNVAKGALPFIQAGTSLAGAGATAYGMQQLAEQTGIAKSAEKRQAGIAKEAQAAAGPVRAFGERQLGQAAAGKVDPAMEAQIAQWVQGAKQKAQDYAARSGQGDSQQLVEWLSWIDQMGEAMRMQALQGEQQLGLTAEGTAANILGVAGGAAGGAGSAAAGQQGSIAQLIAAANQELAKLSGGAA